MGLQGVLRWRTVGSESDQASNAGFRKKALILPGTMVNRRFWQETADSHRKAQKATDSSDPR